MSPADWSDGPKLLLGAYFNQDWLVDHSTPDAVIRAFVEQEPAASRARAAAGLESLIAVLADLTDEAGQDVLEALGCCYLPSADGLRPAEWVAHLHQVVVASLPPD